MVTHADSSQSAVLIGCFIFLSKRKNGEIREMRIIGLLVPLASSLYTTTSDNSSDAIATTQFTTITPEPEISSNVTLSPIVTEQPYDNGFDMGSFFGGVVLTVGVTGTAYFGMKFYKANNPDYRHIWKKNRKKSLKSHTSQTVHFTHIYI